MQVDPRSTGMDQADTKLPYPNLLYKAQGTFPWMLGVLPDEGSQLNLFPIYAPH